MCGGRFKHAEILTPECSGAVVAFEADGKDYGPLQHLRVSRSMRHVACFASIDAYGGVFIDEWAALVGVTLETRFLVPFLLIDHAGARRHSPRCRERAMGIMTVRAFHDSFIHPMLEGHRELRFDGGVAGVTELGLLLCEEEFRRLRAVD